MEGLSKYYKSLFNECKNLNNLSAINPEIINNPSIYAILADKYNKANETTKIGMNTDKIIKAINRKDYDYIYKKLDQDFANNNFGSLEGFENYMNQNFNAIYEATYYNSSKENYVYVQPVTLKVKDSDEQKSLNIIMKLEEGTDFVMSFEK